MADEAVQIKEGFLCPICHRDLRSPNNLIQHFQEVHSQEQDILKSLKDLYGKAKKKILNLDSTTTSTNNSNTNTIPNTHHDNSIESIDYTLEYSGGGGDHQRLVVGCTRSHTDYFRATRRDKLDHRTTETNKLIIRLDRMLRLCGGGGIGSADRRRHHEQQLVAWLDGTTVTRCPSCTANFNLTRRQHHCRLCGSIMCNACSYFLTYQMAQTIVAPVQQQQQCSNVVEYHHQEESGGGVGGGVNSMMAAAAAYYNNNNTNKDNTDSIRVCVHCLDMLEYRRRAQIQQLIQPIICQLYSHLQKLKTQTQNSVDLYLKMYDSLTMCGETQYQLQDTLALRATIARHAETIDTLSKKIAAIDVPAGPDAARMYGLQTSIRRATSHYIKDCLLTLPVPPTAQQLIEIKRNRTTAFATDDDRQPDTLTIQKVTVTTGWSPANVIDKDVISEDDDPLIGQINIVRNYIEQARKAQRFDEVASLKENLMFLQETYRLQQRQKENNN